MKINSITEEFWRSKRVLITGHTGFKGSWLSLWLQTLGAEVSGLSLEPPTEPALFKIANVESGMSKSVIGDIRHLEQTAAVFESCRPEIVFHMAAQPLVRASYDSPHLTYETNVMGTVNVLEAARRAGTVRAIVNVTTDKCYENKEWVWGYREDEAMGGYDPYSSSKGCVELITSAYRRSFMQKEGIVLASARAGNVIGGGDWAADRLIPDILAAISRGEPIRIRNPKSVRPWQHVLEPLSGYLTLAQKVASEQGTAFAEGWNFGPQYEDAREVEWIARTMIDEWGSGEILIDSSLQPHEANYLKLDISKAAARLDWFPRWSLNDALQKIIEWHRAFISGADMRQMSLRQIQEFSRPGMIEGR